MKKISFKRRKIKVKLSQREKSTCSEFHEQKSARKRFHEQKLARNKFHEENLFHVEKINVKVS